jgi:hypothetical protein
MAEEEAPAFAGRLRDQCKQQKSQEPLPVPAGFGNPQNASIWDFVLVPLRSKHKHTYSDIKPVHLPCNVLHTASQISDFSLPFLMLCMQV